MTERDDSHGDIDWGSAEVADGRLTVAIAGGPSKAWAERLAQTVERLQRTGGGWDSIKVTRKRVRVKRVRPGGEADLRHFLEGAVMQANADFAGRAGDGGEADDPEPGIDAEMTAAFRAFSSQ